MYPAFGSSRFQVLGLSTLVHSEKGQYPWHPLLSLWLLGTAGKRAFRVGIKTKKITKRWRPRRQVTIEGDDQKTLANGDIQGSALLSACSGKADQILIKETNAILRQMNRRGYNTYFLKVILISKYMAKAGIYEKKYLRYISFNELKFRYKQKKNCRSGYYPQQFY